MFSEVYLIRFATKNDCNNLAALSIEVWLEIYAVDGIRAEYSEFVLSKFTPEYFEERLNSDTHCILVIQENKFLRGFALVNKNSSFENVDSCFEIEHLYIHRSSRGQGLGRELIDFIASNLSNKLWLYTWVDTSANVFYNRLGFRKVENHTFAFHQWEIANNVYFYHHS
jgi:ribosomal protein S18 acetylase RimI-like enzyme